MAGNTKPSVSDLDDVDAVIYDIQDVGAGFTHILQHSTM
jgi:uncharacterized protein YbbC (DUF1343 family)